MNPHTLHISFYDLLFLGIIFTGLTVSAFLWFGKSTGRSANRYLSLALAVEVLLAAWVLDFGIPQFSLALGPLLYFYVSKLTQPGYKLSRNSLLHFTPVLVAIVCPFQPLVFISVSIYLYCCHQLIEAFYRRLKFNEGDRSRYEFRWLHRSLTAFSGLWLLWMPYAVADQYYHFGSQVAYPLYLIFGVLLIRIGVIAFLRSPMADVHISVKPSLPAELKQKGEWLKITVQTRHLYEDPDLSLSTLGEQLNMNPHELSRIVNVVLKKSFADFVNEYRIRDVVWKMQDPAHDHLTLLGIAYDSGFNSKTNFNRAFRRLTGKSPVEYKNHLKKERPFYNTEPYLRTRPLILHPETAPQWSQEKINRNYMFRNYLKIAWRNMLHNKVSSALNITGLAAGLAVSLLIGLWVFNQYAYDRFLPNYKQVYQVKFNFTDPKDGTHTQPAVCLPLANVLRSTIPGIKRVAETSQVGNSVRDLEVGDKKLLIQSGDVSPDFLKIFPYPFVKGDPKTALKDVYSIIIDESTAKALFGDADPIDKIIRIDNQHDVKVTGVFKDIPATASIKFGCLLPFSYKQLTESWMKNALTQWDNNSFEIWVELQPGVTQEQIVPKIKGLLVKYHPNYKDVKGEVIVHAMKDWHLYSDFKNGKMSGGFIDYVRMFSIIGALVLLIACINFMNLSTARSEKRAREVGVRKAIGSQRKDLIFQFLTESLMITFAAFFFSVLLVQLALAPFNELTGSAVNIPYGDPVFWAIMIGYVLLTGLLAGSRPAFYLSSFNPVKVLKGTIQVGKAASLPRKILVVLQFSCSVALIIGRSYHLPAAAIRERPADRLQR